ncbi:MAG TPA: SCO family protein [Candidatus Binatia bacterium]|jgi:protein SCO1/2
MKRAIRAGALLVLVAALALALPVRRWLGLEPELPVLGQAPEFHLVADDGSAFASSLLDGRVWVASFLYTSCPGPCPRLVERLKQVRRTVPVSSMAIISISVDPDTDTAPVLAGYKTKHAIASSDAWTFLTGPSADVIPLVQRGFLTGVSRDGAPGEEGAVAHGTRVALIDGQHRIRGFYATEEDSELSRLERDAAALAAAESGTR